MKRLAKYQYIRRDVDATMERSAISKKKCVKNFIP